MTQSANTARLRKSRRTACLAALLLGVSGLANATDRRPEDSITVYADVINVVPVYSEYRRREPREECWIEEQRTAVREGPVSRDTQRRSHRRSGGDAIVGGIIGGVIGNQIGRNGNRGTRHGATVAGAIIGSVVANEAGASSSRHRRSQRHAPRTVYETREVERCRTIETVSEERRIQHYDVTYRYEGRTFTTRQPRDPGRRIRLQVSLTPTGR